MYFQQLTLYMAAKENIGKRHAKEAGLRGSKKMSKLKKQF